MSLHPHSARASSQAWRVTMGNYDVRGRTVPVYVWKSGFADVRLIFGEYGDGGYGGGIFRPIKSRGIQGRSRGVESIGWAWASALTRRGGGSGMKNCDAREKSLNGSFDRRWQGGPKNLKTTWGWFFLLRPLILPPPLLPSKQGMFSSKNGMFFPPFFWRNFWLRSWWAVNHFQLSNGSKIFKYTTYN